MIAVMDTDGVLSLIKGYYRISQTEGGSVIGNGADHEVEVESEAKIKPDVMPPKNNKALARK